MKCLINTVLKLRDTRVEYRTAYLRSGGYLYHLLQLSRLKQLDHDVGTADKLPPEVQLGDGWPAAEILWQKRRREKKKRAQQGGK